MSEENGTRLDLICECGQEYEAALMDVDDSVDVTCPKCGKKETITKRDIEATLDKVEDQIWKKLGL